MSTTVDVYTQRADDVVRVPIQSVAMREKDRLEKKKSVEEKADEETEQLGEKKAEMVEVVFVVNDGKAIAKPVKLGISDDSHYAILSGLDEGETVITGPFRAISKTLNSDDLVNIKEGEDHVN